MARRHQLDGLIRWSQRDDWVADFEAVVEAHIAPACEAAGVDAENLPDLIGDHAFMTLWGCAFEDFIAREFDDGSNIIDEYLKRRGWKETAPNRAYMAALRTSAVGLYVTAFYVGGSMGAFLPGLAWEQAGWPGAIAMVLAVLAAMAVVAALAYRSAAA